MAPASELCAGVAKVRASSSLELGGTYSSLSVLSLDCHETQKII